MNFPATMKRCTSKLILSVPLRPWRREEAPFRAPCNSDDVDRSRLDELDEVQAELATPSRVPPFSEPWYPEATHRALEQVFDDRIQVRHLDGMWMALPSLQRKNKQETKDGPT